MEVTEPGQVLARKNGELVKKQRGFFDKYFLQFLNI